LTTQVQFLNGLDTIGGNVVSFTNGNTRLVMDFGMNFAPEQSPSELLANGALPDLPTLFTDTTSEIQETIFVSHLHLDHMGALKYLAKPTNVYMSQESLAMYQALTDLAIESAPNAILQAIQPEVPLKFGPFTITAFLTDHDAPGAYMFRVNDGQHTFVHSGDVRLDGPNPERVMHWANVLGHETIDLFMLEGTEFSFDNDGDKTRVRRTEMSLQADFKTILDTTDQMVVINPYERNTPRLAKLMQTAQEAGRTLVWDTRFSTVLHAMGIQNILELGKDVTWAQILANPKQYVVQNHFNDLHALDQLSDGFVYLHMNGEPLGDYDPRFNELLDYLASRHVEMQYLGASGHATPTDLIKLAELVHAKVTVPWHSFKPEVQAAALQAVGLKVLLPTKGDVLIFD
jgi:ribonuclease J